VSEDDDWDWLLALPRDWERPAELRSPTKSTELNLAIIMLGSESIGNDCIELIGEFLAQIGRFNTWIGAGVKGVASEKELARLYILQQDSVRRVYEAWKSYAVALDSRGGKLPQQEYDQLLTAMRSSNASLAEARSQA